MNNSLITVIDGAKARFLTLEPAEFPDYGFNPRLIEHEGLLNPAKTIHDQDLWSSTKTGCNRGSTGQSHNYDDHRTKHIVEFERRFAHAIATHITQLTQIHHVQQLLLIAEPQILGLTRDALAHALPKNLKKVEIAKDLCRLSPHKLYKYLAEHKFFSH